MSAMDKIKKMLKGHEDQTGKAVDKAGDMIDKKTGNKYQGQVDSAQDSLKRQFGAPGERGGEGNPPQR
ncbi:antitoxin [Streptomyces sp. NBC_00102]|uniref:antitoxin n=1 Tax=Streptomyces sp. NBC_00102 TaxID=2975652 RepID=UPI002257F9CF|nr:antitoxin [Streptomyces sp. NBC_00102]MCX5401916.1 antitoxin [Streptomyces sp. NBC_00102]